MEHNDILDHNDRRRVLIFYGFPALRDGEIFNQVKKDKQFQYLDLFQEECFAMPF